MVGIKKSQKLIELQNERNSINARIDHLKTSHLWNDEEKIMLLKKLNKSKFRLRTQLLLLNPFA
jgi:hypothetical protein